MLKLDKIPGYLRHETTTGLDLREMDAFRGWACLLVLLYHCYLNFVFTKVSVDAPDWRVPGWYLLNCLDLGRFGLDLFFFISGFLLFISFGKAHYENRREPSKFKYFKRRFLRIAPAYYVNLIIIITFLGKLQNHHKGLADIIYHFLFLHNSDPDFMKSINSPFWTLAVEAQFYLILPFMVNWFYEKRWFITLPVILLICGAYRIVIVELTKHMTGTFVAADAGMRLFRHSLLWRLDEFAVGMCFADLWLYRTIKRHDAKEFPAKTAGRIAVLGILAGVAILAVYQTVLTPAEGTRSAALTMTLVYPLLAVAFGAVVWGTIYADSVKKFVAHPLIETLGIISYSVYLWHFVIILGLCLWFPKIGHGGFGAFSLLTLTAFVSSIMIGTASYLLVEKPFLARKRALKTA